MTPTAEARITRSFQAQGPMATLGATRGATLDRVADSEVRIAGWLLAALR